MFAAKANSNTGKHVLIIVTGGTICMEPHHSNGSLTTSSLETRLRMLVEMKDTSLPSFDILEWKTLLDSSEMRFEEWTHIAKDIKEAYRNYDGFVVIHGTDTMAYTAAALSFMFETLHKPVVITGAMLPLNNCRTDAKRNLTMSLLVAANSGAAEVCVLFGNKLLRGNRTVKMDSTVMDSFDSPNEDVLGEMGIDMALHKNRLRRPGFANLEIFTDFSPNVVIIQFNPGLTAAVLSRMITANLDGDKPLGIVLLLYGAGTACSRTDPIVKVIENSVRFGIEMVAITQCIRGTCNLKYYENGYRLYELGVINGGDMTVEAAFAKMSYLLGKGYRGNVLKKLMETNIKGELTADQEVVCSVARRRSVP